MATVKALLDLALTKVGYAYSTGPTRTTGADGYFDCSGFTYFLNQHVGGPTPGFDAQSHLQALYCRDHDLLVGIEHAIATPGALLFEGPDHAYIGGAGIPGHVVVSLGNGHTVEAMGHAWGVVVGTTAGRGWSNAGLFPGIDYAGALSPDHPAPVDGEQLQGENMAVVIPARASVVNGRVPQFVLDVQSDQVFAYNGATLAWKGVPTPPPAHLGNFLVYKIPTAGPHFGMVETYHKKLVGTVEELEPSNVLCVTNADGGCAFADMHYPGV